MLKLIELLNSKRTWIVLWSVLTLYSIAVMVLAWNWGFHKGAPLYKGYFQKPNWALTPFFWTLVIPLTYYTWDGFLEAWRDLFNTKVLHKADRSDVTTQEIDSMIINLNLRRLYIILLSLIVTIVVMYFDTRSWVPCFTGSADACRNNERDFNVAWFLIDMNDHALFIKNAVFVILAYVNQFILILLGFMSFLQMSFHFWIFSNFEKVKLHSELSLVVTLNYESPLNEFGLERWNHTLNNIYWLLSAALIVPLISRHSQPSGTLSDGQIMIQILVPLLFGLPIIFTILQRQRRLLSIWNIIRSSENETDLAKKYHDQKIWPLDRNWASKLGIVIATILLLYLLGVADYKSLVQKLGLL